MKIYVLDDNGQVVFEYDEDSGIHRHGEYKTRQTNELQINVAMVVKAALLYLVKNLVVNENE